MTKGNLFANLWAEPLSLGKDPSSKDISLQSSQEDMRALKVDPSGVKGRFSIGGKAIEAAQGVIEKIKKGYIDQITKEDLQYFLICVSFLLKVQEDNQYVENKNVLYSPQKGVILGYTRNNEPLPIEGEAILQAYHKLKKDTTSEDKVLKKEVPFKDSIKSDNLTEINLGSEENKNFVNITGPNLMKDLEKLVPNPKKGRYPIGGQSILGALNVIKKVKNNDWSALTKEELTQFLICFAASKGVKNPSANNDYGLLNEEREKQLFPLDENKNVSINFTGKYFVGLDTVSKKRLVLLINELQDTYSKIVDHFNKDAAFKKDIVKEDLAFVDQKKESLKKSDSLSSLHSSDSEVTHHSKGKTESTENSSKGSSSEGSDSSDESSSEADAPLSHNKNKHAVIDQKPLSLDDFELVGKKPGGSVPGALYRLKSTGDLYIIKYVPTAVTDNEILAEKFYKAAEIAVPDFVKIKYNYADKKLTDKFFPSAKKLEDQLKDHYFIGVKFIDGLKPQNTSELSVRDDVLDGFIIDAWLGNYDVVGYKADNIMLSKQGDEVRVDIGASLEYKAQGGPKKDGFNQKVNEISFLRGPNFCDQGCRTALELRDPKVHAFLSEKSAEVFKNLTSKNIEEGFKKLRSISNEDIKKIVKEFSGYATEEADKLIKLLIIRKETLISQEQDLVNQFKKEKA